jgi:hypothetical protein
LGLEFGGLSNVSVVLQTQKAKAGIKLFNRDHFSNISNRVKDAKDKMYKAQYVLHTAHGDLTLCMRERAVVHTTLLLSGSKRVFSSRRQGYNDLAWGTRILVTFINQ